MRDMPARGPTPDEQRSSEGTLDEPPLGVVHRLARGTSLSTDELAALSLGKTVSFLIYSLLSFVVVAPVIFLTPVGKLPAPYPDIIGVGLFVAFELALLVAVLRGWLPGTSGQQLEGFSEHQMAIGCTILSGVVWLWPATTHEKEIVQSVINGGLVVGVIVYFVVKSAVARSIRWGVAAVMVLPLLQVWLLWKD